MPDPDPDPDPAAGAGGWTWANTSRLSRPNDPGWTGAPCAGRSIPTLSREPVRTWRKADSDGLFCRKIRSTIPVRSAGVARYTPSTSLPSEMIQARKNAPSEEGVTITCTRCAHSGHSACPRSWSFQSRIRTGSGPRCVAGRGGAPQPRATAMSDVIAIVRTILALLLKDHQCARPGGRRMRGQPLRARIVQRHRRRRAMLDARHQVVEERTGVAVGDDVGRCDDRARPGGDERGGEVPRLVAVLRRGRGVAGGQDDDRTAAQRLGADRAGGQRIAA